MPSSPPALLSVVAWSWLPSAAPTCHGNPSACGRRRFLDNVPCRKHSPRLGRPLSFSRGALVPQMAFFFCGQSFFCLPSGFRARVVWLCTPISRGESSIKSFPTRNSTVLPRVFAENLVGFSFLWYVFCVKPILTHEKLFALGKSDPNATFSLIFLGLSWPWVCLLYTSPSPRD